MNTECIRIGFHTNQLGIRGTDVALFDYAYHTRTIFGGEPFILTPITGVHNKQGVINFQSNFKVYFYNSFEHMQTIIKSEQLDLFYAIKSGLYDGVLSYQCRNAIHAVFESDPHGERYAYVSKWLAMTNRSDDYVPHMIHKPINKINHRKELAIPKDAIVFGWYGGNDSFDIDFVKSAVLDVATSNPNIYFLFMNCRRFTPVGTRNVLYLKPTTNREAKSKFINTCDAMLHARQRGETFGLAVGEFSAHNKPIFTYENSPERAHTHILGSKAVYYSDKQTLMDAISSFDFTWAKTQDWDCYSKQFSPANVMEKFKQVFIT